jgi:hypothetical protein
VTYVTKKRLDKVIRTVIRLRYQVEGLDKKKGAQAMKATMLKKSEKISEGWFYELDTPIEHEGETYNLIVTWSSKSNTVGGFLTFPASSGVEVVKRTEEGKLRLSGRVYSVEQYVKAKQLIKAIGYELA